MINLQLLRTEIVIWNGYEIEIPEPFEFKSVEEIMSYLENNYWRKKQTIPYNQQIGQRSLPDEMNSRLESRQSKTEGNSKKV